MEYKHAEQYVSTIALAELSSFSQRFTDAWLVYPNGTNYKRQTRPPFEHTLNCIFFARHGYSFSMAVLSLEQPRS